MKRSQLIINSEQLSAMMCSAFSTCSRLSAVGLIVGVTGPLGDDRTTGKSESKSC